MCGCKDQSFLIDDRVLFGSGKRFAGNRVDVNHRLTLHSSNFSLDIAGPRCDAQPGYQYHQYESLAFSLRFSPLI
jgi:hypothetical protein